MKHVTQGVRGLITTVNWSVDYDGKSILEIMQDKPNLTYWTLNQVVVNEGGYIDEKGIIHKGSATNKLVEID